MAWTEKDLARRLTEAGVAFELLTASVDTPTVQAAADALRVHVADIVKSVLFTDARDDARPLLVLAQGTTHVDLKKLKAVAAGKWRLATPGEVLAVTGFAVGTVPPVAHATRVPVVMDRRVAERPVMVAGGGGARVMMRIARDDVERLTGASIADVCATKGG